MVGCNNVEIRTPNHHYQYAYEIPSGEMLILGDLIEALEKCFSEKLNWLGFNQICKFSHSQLPAKRFEKYENRENETNCFYIIEHCLNSSFVT